jgi:hypothetical protein
MELQNIQHVLHADNCHYLKPLYVLHHCQQNLSNNRKIEKII